MFSIIFNPNCWLYSKSIMIYNEKFNLEFVINSEDNISFFKINKIKKLYIIGIKYFIKSVN